MRLAIIAKQIGLLQQLLHGWLVSRDLSSIYVLSKAKLNDKNSFHETHNVPKPSMGSWKKTSLPLKLLRAAMPSVSSRCRCIPELILQTTATRAGVEQQPQQQQVCLQRTVCYYDKWRHWASWVAWSHSRVTRAGKRTSTWRTHMLTLQIGTIYV